MKKEATVNGTPITDPLGCFSDEASTLTGFPQRTIVKLCQEKKLPATKIGGRWVINRRKLLAMIEGE